MRQLYTVPEVAKILRVKKGFVYELIYTGRLEALKLSELTAFDLQEALAGLHGALKPRTLKDLYNTLRTAMRQAVAWGLLASDPTAGLRVPRSPRQERRVLTRQELQAVLDAAKGYKYYLVIRLLALTGMRLGKVLGPEVAGHRL